VALGAADAVAGMRAFVVAADGFTSLTDPYCGLTCTDGNTPTSSDAEFGLGFELAGATGPKWLTYHLELAEGRNESRSLSPADFPWVVRRVLPGSPAAKAGLRPGDTIVAFENVEVTVRSQHRLFRRLTAGLFPDSSLHESAIDVAKPVTVAVRRAAGPDRVLVIPREPYRPESVFGVIRRPDGTWDHVLDRVAKVGYIRVGSVELGTEAAFLEALLSLKSDGMTGLVLDLRWCPGGYMEPTAKMVAFLLPPDTLIATVKYRKADRAGDEKLTSPAGPGDEFADLRVAVLVGPDTAGGGEMIAAALQDHERGIVVGQRTVGKGNVMTIIKSHVRGIGYRVSTGYSYRPNGKPRHRLPDSTPFDDWGVRPDPGYGIPVTRDLMTRLGRAAERQAIRPARETDAVAFDDPLADPQKAVAVRLLTERGKPRR
ncbi:MAG: S41 family peptidase, partial [Fimbriiglobus sp.]